MITRETAEKRLEHGASGCFLVRESETKPNCFSLSLKYPGGVAHFSIERKDSGLYEVLGTHKGFTTLPDLIDHFKHHPISEYQHHRLISPCHHLEPPSSLTVEDTPPPVPSRTTIPPIPVPRHHVSSGKHTASTSFTGEQFPHTTYTSQLIIYSNTRVLLMYVCIADQLMCVSFNFDIVGRRH